MEYQQQVVLRAFQTVLDLMEVFCDRLFLKKNIAAGHRFYFRYHFCWNAEQYWNWILLEAYLCISENSITRSHYTLGLQGH